MENRLTAIEAKKLINPDAEMAKRKEAEERRKKKERY